MQTTFSFSCLGALLGLFVVGLSNANISSSTVIGDSDDSVTITLDTESDIGVYPNKTWYEIDLPGDSSWFAYVNDTKDLAEVLVTHKDVYRTPFDQWGKVTPAVKGVWALFQQDLPPVFDAPPPHIVGLSEISGISNVTVTYFQYGDTSFTIGDDCNNTQFVVNNDCGRDCGLKFLTRSWTVEINDFYFYTKGIRLDFKVNRSGDFILVDKIVAKTVAFPPSDDKSEPITCSKPRGIFQELGRIIFK